MLSSSSMVVYAVAYIASTVGADSVRQPRIDVVLARLLQYLGHTDLVTC